MLMITLLAFLLFVSTRKAGIWSAEFLWSAVIMVAVAAVVLTVRYWTSERHSASNGQPQNNRRPSGSN